MVILKISGGFCNQLYQFMTAYSFSKRRGDELMIDCSEMYNGRLIGNVLSLIKPVSVQYYYSRNDCSCNTVNCLSKYEEVLGGDKPQLLIDSNEFKNDYYMDAYKASFKDDLSCAKEFDGVNLYEDCKNVLIRGNFLSYSYFECCLDELRKIITPIIDEPVYSYIKNVINEPDRICVGVHVRRGDYGLWGGVVDIDYYKAAIAYLKDIYCCTDFFVFSDDIESVRSELGVKSCIHYVNIVGGLYFDFVTFFLLSFMKYKILTPGSSYGRMSSLICDNQKMIVYPGKCNRSKEHEIRKEIFYLGFDDINKYKNMFDDLFLDVSEKEIDIQKKKIKRIIEMELDDKTIASEVLDYIDCEYGTNQMVPDEGGDLLLKKIVSLQINKAYDKAIDCIPELYQKKYNDDLFKGCRLSLLGELTDVSCLNKNDLSCIVSKVNILIIPAQGFSGFEDMNYYCAMAVLLKRIGFDVDLFVHESAIEKECGFNLDNYLSFHMNRFVDWRGKDTLCNIYKKSEVKKFVCDYNYCVIITDDESVLIDDELANIYKLPILISGNWFNSSCLKEEYHSLVGRIIEKVLNVECLITDVFDRYELDLSSDGAINIIHFPYYDDVSFVKKNAMYIHNYVFDKRMYDLVELIGGVLLNKFGCSAH